MLIRLWLLINLLLFFCISRCDAQESIAKLKVAPVYTSPGAMLDTKAAELGKALISLNDSIQALKMGRLKDPLQTTLTRLENIQYQLANTLFQDSTHIANLAPKAAAFNAINLNTLRKDSFPINTISWMFSPAVDSAKAINVLLKTFLQNSNPVLLTRMAQSLQNNPQVLHTAGGDSLNGKISRMFSKPLSDGMPILLSDTIPVADLTIVTDTSKPAPPDQNNTKCVKIDSIANFKIDKQADGSYSFAFLDARDNPITKFTLTQLTEPAFNDKLVKALFGLCTASLSKADSAAGDSVIARFQRGKTYQSILEDAIAATNSQDLAGKLTISKHVKVFHVFDLPSSSPPPTSPTPNNSSGVKNAGPAPTSIQLLLPDLMRMRFLPWGESNETMKKSDTLSFTVYSIQIQFQDGFIENIKVMGKIQGEPGLLKFENTLPIAFSTKREFSYFKDVRLFEKTIYNDEDYHLVLGEVISYSENYDLNNKDYCPQNQVYTNNLVSDSVTEVNLYKEQTAQLLQARLFTDLKGLNSDNPNGLVQLELSKKLNLWSHRRPFLRNDRLNYGLFNYISPMFSLNKIESNQKNLTLNSIDTLGSVNNQTVPLTYAPTVQILNHQQFKVGFDLSVFLLDIPGIKSDFNLGITAYFGSTPIQDTLKTDTAATGLRQGFRPAKTNNVLNYDINTFQCGPYISWQIYPSPRFGIIVTYGFFSFKSLSSKFVQVRDSGNYVNFVNSHNIAQIALYNQHKPFASWVNSTEIFAFYSPAPNSQLFFRYRLYKDMNYGKENFRQLQLGVTTYLTTTKQSKDAKANTATSTQ